MVVKKIRNKIALISGMKLPSEFFILNNVANVCNILKSTNRGICHYRDIHVIYTTLVWMNSNEFSDWH